MAAIMDLSHSVKSSPEDFRHSLDGRQMVLFFEKASLRTRLTFEAAIKHAGRQRGLSSTRRSRRWASASRWPTWRTISSDG